MISWGGVFLDLTQKILKGVQDAGGGDEDIHRLVTPGGESTIEEIVRAIMRKLSLLATVKVVGDHKFVARERLQSANIVWTGQTFATTFLGVEEGTFSKDINISCPRSECEWPLILEELGHNADINLSYFFRLLGGQANGKKGHLVVDGNCNIASIVGPRDGKQLAVYAYWPPGSKGWHVDASHSVPLRWSSACRVISIAPVQRAF